MKRLLLGGCLSLLALSAHAGPFDQLERIETEHAQVQADRQAAAQQQWQAHRAAVEAREKAARQTRAVAHQKAAERAEAQRQAVAAENARLRSRAETREDEAHALEIEERKLRLQTLKAKADRSNDYIDAELRSSAAKADVVQSEADANRNISSGTKALLEDTGKASVNKSTRWFGH
jgi:hypothetical protein